MRPAKLQILVLMSALLILAVACEPQGYAPPKDMEYRVGKEGVAMRFLGNSPPDLVYEKDDFNAILSFENRGAHSLVRTVDESQNLIRDDQGVLAITYDPFYIEQTLEDNNRKSISIEGKNQYMPRGDGRMQEYAFRARPLMGQRERPTTTMIFTLCYPYETVLLHPVCVDLDYYNMDARQKVCTAKDLTFDKGQGAPIAITKVETRSLSTAQGTVVEFVIHIENAGGGNVITESSNVAVEDQCLNEKPEMENWNRLKITAELMGKRLDCGGGMVRLQENKAKVRCRSTNLDPQVTTTEGAYIGSARNFHSNLYVNLRYLYQESQSKKITIMRFD